MEREAKKEAFRKYLESSGVLDALTKVLVALYEENDKPSSALEFVQQKLGGPSISEYEKLQAEKSDLQLKYDELLAAHRETCREGHFSCIYCMKGSYWHIPGSCCIGSSRIYET
ncbi:uncharacterized protein LOC135581174 isoform X1 [Musa acuminata AAA Group]|uniref:uncharacterized protein LOC135581174 isoform X1 n=1 Tax=Musa acuminata AAA Group TaxID=214697 RepID=UPI0031D9FDCC